MMTEKNKEISHREGCKFLISVVEDDVAEVKF